MKNSLLYLLSLAFIAFMVSCKSSTTSEKTDKEAVAEEIAEPNTLTQAEIDAGWVLLFDGKTSTGWRGYGMESFPDSGWIIQDGTLMCKGSGRGEAGGVGGDIMTVKKYKWFELKYEWKISEGGNSGVFYLAQERDDQRIWYAAPEMQIVDNLNHPDGRDEIHCAGSMYGLYPAPKDAVKPLGEWNQASILVFKGTVEHVLNGKKLFQAHLWTPEWNARVDTSKFMDFNPGFANVADEGYIGLQDHGDDVWFRNIKIKESK